MSGGMGRIGWKRRDGGNRDNDVGGEVKREDADLGRKFTDNFIGGYAVT